MTSFVSDLLIACMEIVFSFLLLLRLVIRYACSAVDYDELTVDCDDDNFSDAVVDDDRDEDSRIGCGR